MGEHAKLPWEAQSDGWQPWPGAIAIKADDGYIIAYTTSGGKEKENADLLCKAASCHDALVKALEDILSAEKEFREGMPGNWEGDPLTDACADAREVLAKVQR